MAKSIRFLSFTVTTIAALFFINGVYISDVGPRNTAETYNIKALKIPKGLQLAGERVPIERHDIKERMDRELLVNTYWQSNGLLLIKRAHKYFPVIEPLLKKYGIPDDFKYLAVAESGLQNNSSPAGGHNGREETTTFTLIPMVKEQVKIPVIAAGGIGSGRGMLAAMVLGADGVQVGSRFAATKESSAHDNFKQTIVDVKDGDTHLTLKELAPVRLVKNQFYNEVQALYQQNPTVEQIKELLGRARAKKGMFEGDLDNGELEIGQIAGLIHEIKSTKEVLEDIISEFESVKNQF